MFNTHRIRSVRQISLIGVVSLLAIGAVVNACSSADATASTVTDTTANAYTAVYKTLSWGAGVTVSYPTACTMTLSSTGVPAYHDAYYLGPVSAQYPTQVAATASGLKLAVVPYTPSGIAAYTATVNICPAKASAITTTNLGPIGYIISGEYLYNAFEAGGVPAVGDNVSYTFTQSGTTYTASFIDKCNSHPTPLAAGYTWHYHGIPTCVAAETASGSSRLIGIALDGFPVYGGRDINGNVIAVSQLDACNGITSPTSEFPNGAYHYVLPIGVTNKSSSLNCYQGTVSRPLMAQMELLACKMLNIVTADVPKDGTHQMAMSM